MTMIAPTKPPPNQCLHSNQLPARLRRIHNWQRGSRRGGSEVAGEVMQEGLIQATKLRFTTYDLGVDLHVKQSFHCIISVLYTRAILVLSKKHDFRAKYGLFLCTYDRIRNLREFDEFALKTLETDESEAEKLEKKSSKFVEFGRLFVRKFRRFRIRISVVCVARLLYWFSTIVVTT